MSEANKDVKLSLKVMINKEKTKVLFAEADSHFVDILLSFLTLPLGRIIKILEKHYADEATTIGSLSSLYRGLANLGSSHFWSEGAKNTLLNPTSSFEDEYKLLKLDITDSPPAECFCCIKCGLNTFRSESIYYDQVRYCHKCKLSCSMRKKQDTSVSTLACFTIPKASFIIFDDLHVLPNDTAAGLLGLSSFLPTKDIHEAEVIQVDFGLNEIMNLLKALLMSPTPLSDVILNKTTKMKYSATVASQPDISLPQPQIGNKESPKARNYMLKMMIQKSTGKLLYAEAKKDFIEFLFSFVYIPLGGVEHLVAGKTCVKALDNLYRSTIDLKDEYYTNLRYAKGRLIQPNLPHGYMPNDHILPLTEECLPAHYTDNLKLFNSINFLFGKAGHYLSGSGIYQVKDDLTVAPFSIVSILTRLREQKIPISDVKKTQLQIGSKEALRILKASLTSTTALSDALLKNNNNISNKRMKREV